MIKHKKINKLRIREIVQRVMKIKPKKKWKKKFKLNKWKWIEIQNELFICVKLLTKFFNHFFIKDQNEL